MGKQGQFQKRGSIEASLACIQIRRSRAWPCHVIDRWAAKHRIGCVVLLKPGRNLARPRQSFSALYLARISLTLFSPSSFSTDRSRVSTNPCVQPCAPAYRNPWSRAVRSLHRVPTTIHLLSEFRVRGLTGVVPFDSCTCFQPRYADILEMSKTRSFVYSGRNGSSERDLQLLLIPFSLRVFKWISIENFCRNGTTFLIIIDNNSKSSKPLLYFIDYFPTIFSTETKGKKPLKSTSVYKTSFLSSKKEKRKEERERERTKILPPIHYMTRRYHGYNGV